VSDVIPVLRLTPIATQPSPFLFFLASPTAVDCGRICKAQICAHSGIEPSTLTKGFLQGGPKVQKNFEFLTISCHYVPYISATAKNRSLQAAYVAFWPCTGMHSIPHPIPRHRQQTQQQWPRWIYSHPLGCTSMQGCICFKLGFKPSFCTMVTLTCRSDVPLLCSVGYAQHSQL